MTGAVFGDVLVDDGTIVVVAVCIIVSAWFIWRMVPRRKEVTSKSIVYRRLRFGFGFQWNY